jgi:hypothetical protein
MLYRALALMWSVLFTTALHAATFTVDDLGDASDAVPGDTSCTTVASGCTLRAAIEEANTLAGADTIVFSVAGTLTLVTSLPAITQQLTIDGRTAPGYANVPVVTISGTAVIATGLHFAAGSDHSTLHSLGLYGFSSSGILVDANDVGIYGNHLGPVAGGTPNMDGIVLMGERTSVGADGAGNVISGNSRFGILAAGSSHVVTGNFIGTDVTGMTAIANGDDGVHIFALASNVTIGGLSASSLNVISGNGGDGIELSNTSATSIAANHIGLNITGSAAIPNGGAGVRLTSDANDNAIGTGMALLLFISGNVEAGVHIASGSGNVVQNSVIGLGRDSNLAFPNHDGVTINASRNDVLGSVISGNTLDGIALTAIPFAVHIITIRGNKIGTNGTGMTAVPNGRHGVNLGNHSGGVKIGGNLTGQGNIISGNGGTGVTGFTASSIDLYANIIGLAADGDLPLPNGSHGIAMLAGNDFHIGGFLDRGNVISGNLGAGIFIYAGDAHTDISHNRIGTNAAGTAARGNALQGIYLQNTFTVSVRANVISGNAGTGIQITNGERQTYVENIIGRSADGVAAIPNGGDGIRLDGVAHINLGAEGFGSNTISANRGAGIAIVRTVFDTLLYQNLTFDNGGLGIDLGGDGVTLNDTGDKDVGPNGFFNYPVITAAMSSASGSLIRVSRNGIFTGETFTFFHDTAADPSGYGEGRYLLGTTIVPPGGDADANFTFRGPPIPVGNVVTATARHGSEFSRAFVVTAMPELAFSSATYNIDEHGIVATITVTRTADTSGTVTVDYSTSDATATAGSDYTATNGTLTFLPGQTTATFNIPITQDIIGEESEFVNLRLSNPTDATLASTSAAVLTIVDDDVPAITITDITENEGNAGTTSFTFTLTLSLVSTSVVSVDFATADGTATAGSDYSAASGTVTFPPGMLTQTVTVSVLGDGGVENDETFVMDLTNATNGSIADNQATGTIVNDDAFPAPVVPTASEWALVALALSLAALATAKLRS